MVMSPNAVNSCPLAAIGAQAQRETRRAREMREVFMKPNMFQSYRGDLYSPSTMMVTNLIDLAILTDVVVNSQASINTEDLLC